MKMLIIFMSLLLINRVINLNNNHLMHHQILMMKAGLTIRLIKIISQNQAQAIIKILKI